jgi:hypothetical protein
MVVHSMPDTNAGQLTANLLRRLRDPNAVGLSHSFVRSVLSDSQRFVNGLLRRTKTTVTLTTNPNQMFYPYADIASDILRIEFVRESDRDLKKTTLRELGHVSFKWFRDIGPRFKQFALPGRDLLVVYPARNVTASVDVVYTKLTNAFDDDTIEAELPADEILEATDLAQIIMLVKMRKYELLEPILSQFVTRHGLIAANESK